MKTIIQKKAIIGLFILMLGFTYISAPTKNLEENVNSSKSDIVYKNN